MSFEDLLRTCTLWRSRISDDLETEEYLNFYSFNLFGYKFNVLWGLFD